MKTTDIIKISQTNLFKSKLRTFLTILAVFIGTFTISITNGVGNGIRAYVDQELGNVGVEDTLLVQASQSQNNPVSSEVVEYDPNKTTGLFNIALLNGKDVAKIRDVKGVEDIIPVYDIQIDYITAEDKKYEAVIQQYIDGLNLNLEAGRILSGPGEITIPDRYVKPLGFENNEAALDKGLVIGYRNSKAERVEKPFKIVGIQQQSILGSSSLYIHVDDAREIQKNETEGIARQQDSYPGLLISFNQDLTEDQIVELKQLLNANGYNAMTIQDQIGIVSRVINTALIVLNIFGAIALLAAAFGIVNTLLMAVNERTSEIGLMKALGANSQTIFSIFSLEAASIGFWGGLLGILASIGVGTIVNKIATNSFLKDFAGFNLLSFPLDSTILTLLGIVALAFVAGSLPSVKASRLDPIRALRYE